MKSAIFKTFVLSLLTVAQVHFAYAQTASILPPAKTTFVDQNGKPLTAGTVDFYIPNTTTRKTTWQDAAETVPNANPVVLDGAGRALILGSGTYRQVVKDKLGNTIWDQVTSSAGSGSSSSTATGDGDLVGTIKPWSGMTAPNQYVFAYGEEISRTTYATFFTAVTSAQPAFCNSGSAVLSGLSDTTNFWIGMTVETSCVVTGKSTIIAKTASSVTMAANANVTVNTTATFFPWGDGNGTTTFNVPDLRGYVLAGNANMGGTATSTLTSTYFGSQSPNSIGASGGQQSLQLATSNLPPYTPAGTITNGAITTTITQNAVTSNANTSDVTAGAVVSTGGAATITAASSQAASTFAGTAQGGTTVPLPNVQPTKTVNYIVKIIPDTNSATASGVTSLGSMTGSLACGTGILCTGNTVSANVNITHTNTSIYATDYGVKCDGTTDDTTAAQTAITAGAGMEVIFPAGTCLITSTLSYTTTSANVFTQGMQITGQGREKTIFDSRVASNFLFATDTNTDSKFQSGITFKNFKITSNVPAVTSSGIRVHKGAYVSLDNIQITGLTGNGFYIPAAADPESTFVIKLDRVRMDNISGWCVLAVPDGSGTEISNLRITNSTFQACGTPSASVPPPSGAIEYRGLIAQIDNTGFTLNNNVAIYGAQSGTISNLTIHGSDFENTISTVLPNIYIDTGLRNFRMTNSECLNNDTYISQGCAWFNSTAGIQAQTVIDGVKVRATTLNNPYVAFQATGANLVTEFSRVKNIYWQDFDHTGQTRFSGFQFDTIPGQAKFSITGVNTAGLIPTGVGAAMPMKLAATGEWIQYQVPNAGLTKTGIGGVTPSTTYYFYLYNSATALLPIVGTIEISATGPSATFDQGYSVKTGDSTRAYIGSATSDGSGNFGVASPQLSWYPPSGTNASLGVGSSSISAGTTTRVLYDNAGTLGEYAISGTGSVAMTASPTFTGTLTAATTTLSGALTYGGVTLSNAVTGTGNMVLSASPTLTGTLSAAAGSFSSTLSSAANTITSASANALAVGLAGATNPVLQVDASIASQAAGLKITGGATGNGTALLVTDSGANSPLSINAKNTGTISIGNVSTGALAIGVATAMTSASASAFAVGPAGATNPALKVDASAGSLVAGLLVTGAATGGTVALAAIDSGSNTNLSINGKGTGTIAIGNVSTGAVTITPATTFPGTVAVTGNFGTSNPLTKTANYSQLATDSTLIFNGTGTITLTLQAASSYPGRHLYVNNIAAFTVVSASSNVVPQAGGAAGTAILAATAGKWALLQSNGTNWVIIASN